MAPQLRRTSLDSTSKVFFMPIYQARYSVGSTVRIASRDALDQFRKNWLYHHPLSSEQLDYADQLRRCERSATTTVATSCISSRGCRVRGMRSYLWLGLARVLSNKRLKLAAPGL